MKTTRMISLLLALCFVLLLAGCGAAPDKTPAEPEKTPEDLATETVTGLMDSLVDGHPAEAKKFCAEEIWEAGLFDEFFDPEDPESAYEYMGISEENGISPELLNEETKDSVIRFIETYNDAMFQEYELKDLSVDGDTAKAAVNVTYGIDPEKMSGMDPSELVSEAAMAILYNALLPVMMDAMGEYLKSVEPSTEDWNITLAKTDGEWKITSIKSA